MNLRRPCKGTQNKTECIRSKLIVILERKTSFVWRIEHGERRLDVVEFFWVCEALGQDAKAIYAELAEAFKTVDTPR